MEGELREVAVGVKRVAGQLVRTVPTSKRKRMQSFAICVIL